jgi:hypothetical protein
VPWEDSTHQSFVGHQVLQTGVLVRLDIIASLVLRMATKQEGMNIGLVGPLVERCLQRCCRMTSYIPVSFLDGFCRVSLCTEIFASIYFTAEIDKKVTNNSYVYNTPRPKYHS